MEIYLLVKGKPRHLSMKYIACMSNTLLEVILIVMVTDLFYIMSIRDGAVNELLKCSNTINSCVAQNKLDDGRKSKQIVKILVHRISCKIIFF